MMHSFDSLVRTRRTTEAIGALPAVPHLDWFDRAAAALSGIADGAACILLLVTADPSGRLLAHHAVGAAGPAEAVETLRARARRISELGFDPAGAGAVAPVQALDPAWQERQTGRLWAGLDRPDVICGSRVLPGGSCLLAFIALKAGGQEAAPVLRAVLPALADRADRCLGPAITNASAWLTAREQEVLDQLTLGRSVRQIATILERSPHTVHDHVKSLHRKLGASTRGGLIARAMGHAGGEIEPKSGQRQTAR